MAQVAIVKLDGKEIQIQDLPVGLIDEVAKAADVPWWTLIDQPLLDLNAAAKLLDAVAKHIGTSVPVAELTFRNISEFFDLVEDDVPESGGDDDHPKDEESTGDES